MTAVPIELYKYRNNNSEVPQWDVEKILTKSCQDSRIRICQYIVISEKLTTNELNKANDIVKNTILIKPRQKLKQIRKCKKYRYRFSKYKNKKMFVLKAD